MSDSYDKPLYTDVLLEMASAFINREDTNTMKTAIAMIFDDEQINGPGMMPGLIYAGILHFIWSLGTLSQFLGISIEEAIMLYSKMYFEARDNISQMITLRPEFVDMITSFYSPED